MSQKQERPGSAPPAIWADHVHKSCQESNSMVRKSSTAKSVNYLWQHYIMSSTNFDHHEKMLRRPRSDKEVQRLLFQPIYRSLRRIDQNIE